MAAGLAGMVASMSRGKKAYLQYESQLSEAIARLTPLREELKSAIDADAESYNVVMKAYKAAKETKDPGDGSRAINAALRQATSVPLGVAEKAVEVARIADQLKPIYQPQHELRSDHRHRPGRCRSRRSARQRCDQSGFNQSGFAGGRGFRKPNAETRGMAESKGLTVP